MMFGRRLQQEEMKFSEGVKEKTGAYTLRPRIMPMALLSVALLSTTGCVEGHPFRGAIRAAPSPVLQLSWAIARRTDAGITLRGQITQVKCCSPSVEGHLHITAVAGDGVIVSEKDVRWGDFIARQLHSASFKTKLAVPKNQAVSNVEIQFIISSAI